VSGTPLRILIVNQYAGSPVHGMEFRAFELAREWLRLGHEVLIIAGSPSHLRSRQPSLRGLVTRERVEGVQFEWLRLPQYRGNGVRRAANVLAFAGLLRARSGRIARRFRPDIVIASSTHPLDIYGARAIAGRSGARLVFEIHDIWPLTPIEVGGLSPRHPFIMLMGRAERYACAHADVVVSVLPKADEHLVTRGMDQSKYFHIPNGIDIASSDARKENLPGNQTELLCRLQAEGTFLVGYAGGIGLANAVDDLVSAAALLRNEAVAFVIWGDGPLRGQLEARIRDEQISNVHLLGAIPRPAVRTALEACDVLYLGWKRHAIYRFGLSPNKLFDYLASGRPVLHATSAPGDPVAAYEAGVSVPAEDPEAIAQAIRELASLPPEMLDVYGARGRAQVLAHHDYPVLARRFLSVVARPSPTTTARRI
jgi:glycosyltransferase involved in cell wall biosynthesis